MSDINILNEHIDMCMKYWNGEITEKDFEENRILHISQEVDTEMQRDSFY